MSEGMNEFRRLAGLPLLDEGTKLLGDDERVPGAMNWGELKANAGEWDVLVGLLGKQSKKDPLAVARVHAAMIEAVRKPLRYLLQFADEGAAASEIDSKLAKVGQALAVRIQTQAELETAAGTKSADRYGRK